MSFPGSHHGPRTPHESCAAFHSCSTLPYVGFFCSMRCFVVQQGGGCPSGKGIAGFVQGGGDGGECCAQGWGLQHSKDLEQLLKKQ